jgi:hypothetical protein
VAGVLAVALTVGALLLRRTELGAGRNSKLPADDRTMAG